MLRIGLYVPQCDDNGNYNPNQNDGSTGQQWCVDWDGGEIPGTRVGPGKPKPDCRAPVVESYGVCSTYGDIHYSTFDGPHFDFQGTCKHLLAGLCGSAATKKTFKVYLKGEYRGSKDVSWVKYVEVVENGNTIRLQRNSDASLTVTVNKKVVNVPYDGRGFTIKKTFYVAIKSPVSGLEVRFDGYSVSVRVPRKYAGQTCGMCGNMNRNAKDDLPFLPAAPTISGLLNIPESFMVDDDEEPSAPCSFTTPPGCVPIGDQVQYCKDIAGQSAAKCVGKNITDTLIDDCLLDVCFSDEVVVNYFYAYINQFVELVYPRCTLCSAESQCDCPSLDDEQLPLPGNCTHYCQCSMGQGCVKPCPDEHDPSVPICVPISDVGVEWAAFCSGESTTKAYYGPV
jgi:hypothetical protein